MTARLVVCEPASNWVISLRHCFRDSGLEVTEVRTVRAAWTELEQFPSSVVCWCLPASQPGSVLENVFAQHLRFPDSHGVVLGERRFSAWRWLAMEAGAVDAVFSPRDLRRIAGWVVRHIRARAEPVGPASARLTAGAWRLPWVDEGAPDLGEEGPE